MMKTITTENWLTHDPKMNAFGAFSDDPNDTRKGGSRLVNQVALVHLPDSIPEGVRHLFEMARGAICYGVLFYPLYTLGAEQVFRCLDEALRSRLANERPRATPKNFSQRIEMARLLGLILEEDILQWNAIRELRNAGAHSDGHPVFSPGDAIASLSVAAELIAHLFESHT